jgi:hypothetical protein
VNFLADVVGQLTRVCARVITRRSYIYGLYNLILYKDLTFVLESEVD